MPADKLDSLTLLVSVWHHDKFGHNKFLGEVKIRTHSDIKEKPDGSIDTYVLKSHVCI